MPIAIAACAALTLYATPATPALAGSYPIKVKTLTANKLYSSGTLLVTQCPEKPRKSGNAAAANAYLKALRVCMNVTWAAQFAKSGQIFSAPTLKVVTKAPANFCGRAWRTGARSYYCHNNKTILIVLSARLLKSATSLELFAEFNLKYGYHIQHLTGIRKAFEAVKYSGTAELNEQKRRFQLQNDCLAATFLRSVWTSLKRPTTDWDKVVATAKKDHSGAAYGSAANIGYWMSRGYSTAHPGTCNTWLAPAARVA